MIESDIYSLLLSPARREERSFPARTAKEADYLEYPYPQHRHDDEEECEEKGEEEIVPHAR